MTSAVLAASAEAWGFWGQVIGQLIVAAGGVGAVVAGTWATRKRKSRVVARAEAAETTQADLGALEHRIQRLHLENEMLAMSLEMEQQRNRALLKENDSVWLIVETMRTNLLGGE